MPSSPVARIVKRIRKAVLCRADVSLSDGQLLDCYLEKRDEAAFAALVHRHGPMVWGVCQRITGDAADAEDAFQAAFLILIRKAAAVKPREAVGNWLYGVARHTALKAKTASHRVHAKEKQVTNMPEPAPPPRDDREELEQLLDQELSALPDHYRLPVVLCNLEGRTRKKVAAQLKIPEGTLSSRLATAHQMLAKRLAGHGLAVTGGSLAALFAQNAAPASVPAAVVCSAIKTAALVATSNGAVAGVVSAKVAALTEGVLKTMLFKKIMTTTLVVLALSAAVITGGSLAIGQTGGTGKPPVVEKPAEPAPRALNKEERLEADNSYSLKDGDVLKLIPAPFPDTREAVYKLAGKNNPFIMAGKSADECLLAVTIKDGKLVSVSPFATRVKPSGATGQPLATFLDHPLGVDMATVSDPHGLLQSTILDADVVVQKSAAPNDVATGLRKELRAKCGIDLVLEYRDLETEVVVVSGKHAIRSAQLVAAVDVVALTASSKQENYNSVYANTAMFPGILAQFVGRPVIDESDLKVNVCPVAVAFHVRSPETPKTRAEDRDPVKVLKNLQDQTGLTFKLEKRKVRALVVERSKKEAEKQPFTAWGKEVGGLQAGLGLDYGNRRTYGHGEGITLVVRLRNVGKDAVKFEYLRQFLDENPPTVTNADGKTVSQRKLAVMGFHVPVSVTLEPGKDMILETRMHGANGVPYVLIPQNTAEKQDSKASPLVVGTGKVHLQMENVFGNSSSGFLKVDPALSKLATGKLELEVKEPERLPPEKEPFTAWGKEVGGLKAGLGFKSGEKRIYYHGEKVKLVVRVRNVGKTEAKFDYIPEFFIENPPTVLDEKGKPVSLAKGLVDTGVQIGREANLAPGKEIELAELTLEFGSRNEAGDGFLKSLTIYGTGKFQVEFEKVLGTGFAKLDPALSKLATGKLELEVKAEEPAKMRPKDLGKIQPPGGVPLFIGRKGEPIRVDGIEKARARLEAVPEKDLEKWVVELERIMDNKLKDGLPSARQVCRTDFAIRLSVAFDDLKWNAKAAGGLFSRAQTMPAAEAKAWKEAFEALLKKKIGQTDNKLFDGGPAWAVPLVLIPVDALHEGQKYSVERGKKYRARLTQVTADDVSLWKDKVDTFGGTSLDAAVNIILLDDFFDNETFQRDKFRAAVEATKR